MPWPQSFVKQSETQKVQQPEQPPKLPDQEPVCSKDKEIGTAQVIDSPKIMFIAGNLKHCYPAWQEITSDPVILNIINKGWQINVKNHIPCKGPFEHKHSQRDSDIISEEIKKLLQKQVITQCDINHGDYFSSMFVRPKNEGSFRTILNLKYLNEECFTYHFKMETIKQVIHMVTPNCYLASLDIKDAFYTVPIYEQHKRYLKFLNTDIAYQFEVIPNGYLDAESVYNNSEAIFFLSERARSFVSNICDDSLLAGDTYKDCLDNVHETKLLLEGLGFHIHPKKSVFLPTQVITFLRFEINTVTMTISLTNAKKNEIRLMCYYP